jgi:hypothetical protein
LICPALCFGGWFAHDASAELPGQHDQRQSCDEHACFCNGATVSPEKPGNVQSFELPVAVVLSSLVDSSAPNLFARVDAISFVSSPPASDRVLPLLI